MTERIISASCSPRLSENKYQNHRRGNQKVNVSYLRNLSLAFHKRWEFQSPGQGQLRPHQLPKSAFIQPPIPSSEHVILNKIGQIHINLKTVKSSCQEFCLQTEERNRCWSFSPCERWAYVLRIALPRLIDEMLITLRIGFRLSSQKKTIGVWRSSSE